MINLKPLREKCGKSQLALAVKLSVSQQAVAKWESGEAFPRAEMLPELAKELGCTIDDLFANETETVKEAV